jgi:hypothetical protein
MAVGQIMMCAGKLLDQRGSLPRSPDLGEGVHTFCFRLLHSVHEKIFRLPPMTRLIF